jgi:hypothetical protein
MWFRRIQLNNNILKATAAAPNQRLRIMLIIIGVILGLQFGVFAALQWYGDIRDQIDALKSAIARKTALIENETLVNDLYQQAEHQISQWRSRYPEPAQDSQTLQLSLQKQIETLAEQYQITIVNMDWLPAGSPNLARGAVRFRMEATPDAFMHLVHALETSPYFIALDSIRITTRGQKQSFFTANLEISAYGVSD